jgi:phosphoribosylglycinamide formyltransferase-1
MSKVVVMASGEGGNFSAIVESEIQVDCVITDNKNANVIKRAEKVNVPVFVFDKKEGDYKNGIGWSERRIDETIPEDTDLIVLAGYMRILSPYFVEKWKDKLINIHPSLLPAFGGGCHAIKDAWEHGCRVFGITIHWVTEDVDAGPIIEQRAIHKDDYDTLELITDRIHRVEHYTYPDIIKKILQGEILCGT